MLADWLEQLKPELVRRFATDRLPALLEALVQSLRDQPEVGFEGDADLATLQLLEATVYEAIEERALPLPPHDVRLLGQWFARRIESVVRAERSRLAAMLDAIPDHLLLADVEGHLIYANHDGAQFLSRLKGLPPAQLLGQGVADGLPDRYRAELETLLNRVRSGETVTEEFLFEGSWREHHVTPVRDTQGNLRAVAVASRDIGKRKHAQEELARAVAFRERMMGVLGHDLRNPLNMVLMQAQLLQRHAEISNQTRDGIARIMRAANRMDELIGTLLDVTRLRAGRDLRLSLDTVDLATVVHEVVDELRVAHRDRTIEVTTTGELRGRWDAARIAQVVSNLVANALTHGDVDAPVQLSLWEDGESVALAVTNRGPTIPNEVAGRLFEPFWQAPSDGDPRRHSGLGLGLYIVREIVDAHGGTIDVRSRDGMTTFTVLLPRPLRPAFDAFDAAPPH